MRQRRVVRVLAALAAAALLAACVGGGLGMAGGGGVPDLSETLQDDGSVRLILEPVDAWDDKTAGALEVLQMEGGERMSFRLRQVDNFERAWVRLGLFWDSRRERVYMPVVITGGPPVELKQVAFRIDGARTVAKPDSGLTFTPGKRGMFDEEGKMYSAVFPFSPEILAKIESAGDVHMIVTTNRGGLRVNLAVATGRAPAALAASGKAQFARFYRRMLALR